MKTAASPALLVTLLAWSLAASAGAAGSPAPANAEALGSPPASGPFRAIAIAEDERRYSDGELKRLLAHTDPAVRARAALAVGRLQDTTAVADLLPILNDGVPEVRREAVFALGQIGLGNPDSPAARASRAALEARLKDSDDETVELAIEALGKLGDRAATARLVPFLGDNAPGAQRGHAAVALWRLADSTALGALVAHHNDPDPEIRWRVLYALEKLPAAADRTALIAAIHLDDSEALVRAHAARTLGRLKSARATAYLLQALADAEPAVVVNALRALQQIADSNCVSCARSIARLLGHAHPYVRVTAATALAERAPWAAADSAGRRAALDSLAEHLSDRDAASRAACARALLARGQRVTPQLTRLLADSSLYARVAVLQALTLIPPREAAPLLEARLDPKAALFERMTAAEALGTLKLREAMPRLRAGLADSSTLFVASCAGALGALGDSASVPLLARTYAERAREADADARISIRDALRTLAGRAFADSIEHAHAIRSAAAAAYAPDFAEAPAARGAVLHSSAGDIEWEFYGREAPQTVKNFVRLAAQGYFDGLALHRVVPDFVIQDGDRSGTGSGGPGYTIRCEYNQIRYDAGMVGMALSGKDTGGSQWFITLSPQPHLNGRYTIFAHVTSGLDVARRLVQGDRVLKVEILR